MTEHTPQIPDWYAGTDDQVSLEEQRRRRNHIENVHPGEYLIVIDPRHQMVGTPLKVLGVSGPLILCLDDVHDDALHCLDVRRHQFVHASDEYTKNYLHYARITYGKMKAAMKAKKQLGLFQEDRGKGNPPAVGIEGPPPIDPDGTGIPSQP